jgi:hypothetical protein
MELSFQIHVYISEIFDQTPLDFNEMQWACRPKSSKITNVKQIQLVSMTQLVKIAINSDPTLASAHFGLI